MASAQVRGHSGARHHHEGVFAGERPPPPSCDPYGPSCLRLLRASLSVTSDGHVDGAATGASPLTVGTTAPDSAPARHAAHDDGSAHTQTTDLGRQPLTPTASPPQGTFPALSYAA